jgi:uncharacterized Rmd1/YagE family protein
MQKNAAAHAVAALAADRPITARAIQLGERIETRGLERDDAFSTKPLAFGAGNGAVVLFRSGAAVFFNLGPVEEEAFVASIEGRIGQPIGQREVESASVGLAPAEDDAVTAQGAIQLKRLDTERLLLVAEALAMSASLSWNEARISRVFDRAAPVAERMRAGKLPGRSRKELLEQVGESLSIAQRLAGRADLEAKPDVLWDHPELERLWAKLVDEYDLVARSRAVERRLAAIRETSETMVDLLTTRTSHRLEWYIIGLIAFEIVLTLAERF